MTGEWGNEHPGELKIARKKYRQSEKGKRTYRIHHAKQRGLGYNELCKNPYPKSIKIAYHHINNNDVIPIPYNIHIKHSGNGRTHKQHIKRINDWIKENYPIKNILVDR